jgi:hypothetical protein
MAGLGLVDVLVDAHRDLRVLCIELTDLGGPAGRRRTVADALTATLIRHLAADEQFLYPTLRAVLPDGARLADQEIAADQRIRHTLHWLLAAAPGDDGFECAVVTITTQVGWHLDEAARLVFPRLRVLCTETELARLGHQIEFAHGAAQVLR